MYSNLKVGFTPIIMLEEVDYLHEVVQKIPLERIVLETDAPYFINNQMMLKAKEFTHPGCVMYTALKVAKLRNIPIEDVVKANYDNCDKLYNLPRCVYNFCEIQSTIHIEIMMEKLILKFNRVNDMICNNTSYYYITLFSEMEWIFQVRLFSLIDFCQIVL